MCTSAPSFVSLPGVVRQLPQAYRFRVGSVLVTALSDGSVPLYPKKVLKGIGEEVLEQYLGEYLFPEHIETSINVFLVELKDRRVLIDVGAGEFFGEVGGRMLENLSYAGVHPRDVTDILVTHAHADHAGGLVSEGEPTFPNAVVHIGQADIDYFLDPAESGRAGYLPEDMADIYEQMRNAIGPYVASGQVQTFDREVEILPGITASPCPGHTPGSACYTIKTGGGSLVFVGDMVHVEAVQFRAPEVSITYDVDPDRAAETRSAMFSKLAAEGALVAAPHLRYPGIGHIRKDSKGFSWIPMIFGDRYPG
ncbi:MBL fold metallo-hydrolase [Caballeronia sp. J97]|uniref:MBL fold metallo-hydrolase n=1 Tax=Caballeronia sp. J97 TaxID=2805429 RepID=UPI002AAFE02F|nr:MBL fold metallo-hydrolase [Caballeronia sp. J97]